MTEDSQLIGELERAGSRDEMQGRAYSKKEVEDTVFYRESLTNLKDYLEGRTAKIRTFQDYRVGISKKRGTQIYPSTLSNIVSYTPRKKVTSNYCPGI